ITPAGDNTDYPKGVSVQNVPDMPDPGPGSQTFFYSNQQSARLMFYHDHAYGITRLNVYAGEASGYLLTDAVEQDLITRGILPDLGTPLIIQDKTFVDPSTVLTTDPTWPFALDLTKSNLFYPHVYMPNQNPNDLAGVNAMGRWDYGPWFWPPWPVTNQPITLPDGTLVPNLPDLSMTMEAYHDTPLVNGTAYPYMNVDPKAYRFRILNAANDRMWNLQLYVADPTASTEVKMVPAVTGTAAFPVAWTAQTTGQPGDILDGRMGGVPDPALIGPSMIQIGTEGGFLPTPVVFSNIPIGFDKDPKSITIGNVKEHNLFIGPAERADVVIDFSQFAGKTIILYNDAPAAVPAADSRLDYYTGQLDQTVVGGTKTTLPGYGPNTRTIMQFRVSNATPAPFNLTALNAEFTSTATKQGVFARGQDPIIVPQAPYNSAYNATFPAGTTAYARIQNTSLTFTPIGAAAPVTLNFQPKAIQELFENTYGRMAAYLGVELPFTNGLNQTTIDFGYIDPATEIIKDTPNTSATPIGSLNDGTQIWKITHNGVDTHPIHFHLFNVQLINRVDWAGVVKPPEPNELGWKETIRMNPLEDAIVAFRASAPKLAFGVPDSIRPLDPTMPIGSTTGFRNVDANGNAVTTTNQLFNFGWEYVWHCHILSHEEMDMMRPMVFNVGRQLPIAPILSAAGKSGTPINLTWIDGTPASAPATLGNPANEIGFRIERAVGTGAFVTIGTALANSTTFNDTTTSASNTYQYRVIAFNVAGDSLSNTVTVTPPVALTPTAPSNLTAVVISGTQINLSWLDNSNNETSFAIWRAVNGGAASLIGSITRTSSQTTSTGGTVTYNNTKGIAAGNTYTFYVTAVNAAGASLPSNTVIAVVPTVPTAPSNAAGVAVRNGGQDRVTLTWKDNSNNEVDFEVQRANNVNFNNTTSYTVTANTTSFVQNAARNSTFYYRVRARNVAGNSGWAVAPVVNTP
ncbi:MAG: multicopper oxidase domain-containing protein, partial [Candidatus Omnitrophica bacterium]|nr:multicopper oxidase domain-containing protein [Candidatus Omnitrophota bacterium]